MKIGLCGSPHQRGQAFTLAEVMISVVVVGVTFVALYAGLYFSFNVTRFERENLRATQILMERTEALRLLTMSQVTNTTINPTAFYERYYPGAAGIGVANGIIYTGQVNWVWANLAPSTYATQVLKLTISVQWSSGNIPRSRSLTTFVAAQGLQNYVYDKN